MLILFEYLLFIQMEPHNTDYNTLNVNKAYFVQIIKKFNAQYFKTMLLSFPFVTTPMILPFIIKRNNRCKQFVYIYLQVLGTKNPTDATLVLSKMEKILSKIGTWWIFLQNYCDLQMAGSYLVQCPSFTNHDALKFSL